VCTYVQCVSKFLKKFYFVGGGVGWTIGILEFDSWRGLGIFIFTTAPRTALGPTQSLIGWVPGALSIVVKRPGLKVTTHLHLVPR
jgi:hypothetical protein